SGKCGALVAQKAGCAREFAVGRARGVEVQAQDEQWRLRHGVALPRWESIERHVHLELPEDLQQALEGKRDDIHVVRECERDAARTRESRADRERGRQWLKHRRLEKRRLEHMLGLEVDDDERRAAPLANERFTLVPVRL